MDALYKEVRRFVRSDDGPTATEYAVLMAMILLTAIGSIAAFGPVVASKLVIPGW